MDTCAQPRSSRKRPSAWTRGRPPLRSRIVGRDLLGEREVVGLEVDVVGDQERAGPHHGGAGRRMPPSRPEVGLVGRSRDQRLEALELRLADVAQHPSLRSRRRLSIQVDRQFVVRGEPPAERAGERDALVHGAALERDERDHVDRADARVLTLVAAEIDSFDRHRGRGERGLGDRVDVPGKGEHAAVVVGVRGRVEQRHTARFGDGSAECVEDVGAATLAEVGHAFDQSRHGC